MDSHGIHRPRNVGWRRAAAMLYGDWGTSKAYVIGLAFVAAGYSSLWLILAVALLTAVVGYNYTVVCRHFPDGGGVYSAARDQNRFLAVTGALLLVANFTVTAALSGFAAMSYFGVPKEHIPEATMAMVAIVGLLNLFGPKHSGILAVTLALPMVLAVLAIIGLSLPHLTVAHLEPLQGEFKPNWIAFTGVILALSGVEAIASLTGVMKLNLDATMEKPNVSHTATRAILPVAFEVVLGTVLLGWAMLSLKSATAGLMSADQLDLLMRERWEDMVKFLAEQYGTVTLGPWFGKGFGLVVGIVVGLLLLSAVNTAVAALVGVFYMLARDGEMPRPLLRLNKFGVPRLPLVLAALLPIITLLFSRDLVTLAGLYAISVVGAIAVNLGSCTFNRRLALAKYERALMFLTFLVLAAVWVTIAKTKPDAFFFAFWVVAGGFTLRYWAQHRAGLRTITVPQQVAAAVAPESFADFKLELKPSQTILVAARGRTPVLQFALDEARLRKASLYVLYIKELALSLPVGSPFTETPRWQDDPEASRIMPAMMELGRQHEVPVIPLYTVSDIPSATILDLAATLGVDLLILGGSHRMGLERLLKGSVVTEVARGLPENIQLLIYG